VPRVANFANRSPGFRRRTGGDPSVVRPGWPVRRIAGRCHHWPTAATGGPSHRPHLRRPRPVGAGEGRRPSRPPSRTGERRTTPPSGQPSATPCRIPVDVITSSDVDASGVPAAARLNQGPAYPATAAQHRTAGSVVAATPLPCGSTDGRGTGAMVERGRDQVMRVSARARCCLTTSSVWWRIAQSTMRRAIEAQ
jgi:hypothetical protein